MGCINQTNFCWLSVTNPISNIFTPNHPDDFAISEVYHITECHGQGACPINLSQLNNRNITGLFRQVEKKTRFFLDLTEEAEWCSIDDRFDHAPTEIITS